MATPSLPVRNFKELIAYAKANPDKLNFGTPGNGTAPHLAMKLLEEATAISVRPAVSETYPGFEASTWYQLLAPAGTPAPIIAKLNEQALKFVNDPSTRDKLLAQGAILGGSTPAQLAEYSRAETRRWGALISKTGIKLD